MGQNTGWGRTRKYLKSYFISVYQWLRWVNVWPALNRWLFSVSSSNLTVSSWPLGNSISKIWGHLQEVSYAVILTRAPTSSHSRLSRWIISWSSVVCMMQWFNRAREENSFPLFHTWYNHTTPLYVNSII